MLVVLVRDVIDAAGVKSVGERCDVCSRVKSGVRVRVRAVDDVKKDHLNE